MTSLIAINSALEVDLTGQVCAESIGQSIPASADNSTSFAAPARSRGGKPIIALAATARGGELHALFHN
jgi:acyl-CoA hydrolase